MGTARGSAGRGTRHHQGRTDGFYAHLVEGHTFLDARVRDVAARLGLDLPNQPNAQQRGWLATLETAHGTDYDRKFANLLRRAHGKVFAVVAQVRANTRNSLVRDLADDANTTVLDHIKVLEATGYVDFDALARDAATAAPPLTASPAPPGPTDSPGTPVPVTPSAAYPLPRPPPAPGADPPPPHRDARPHPNVTDPQRSVHIVNRPWRRSARVA